MDGDLPVLSAGGPREQFPHGQGCPLFDVGHPAFSLLTGASPTLQNALKDGFGKVIVAHDIPKPCGFPSLDSCQKRFLRAHKRIDLSDVDWATNGSLVGARCSGVSAR